MSAERKRFDVAVIGCGIIGAACAFRLAEAGLSVVVLEQQEAPAMGSTGRSAAGVRVQFTDATNIQLSLASIREFQRFEELYGADCGYQPIGYLFLVPERDWDQHLAAVDLQRSLGAPVETLALDEAAERFSPFTTAGLGGATYGPIDGIVDPDGVTHAYLAQARSHGALARFNAPVDGLRKAQGGWEIETRDAALRADIVVNAAGSWSGQVAALAGITLPIEPVRRMVFATAPDPQRRTQPLTIDVATGFYFRSEGPRLLFGRSNPQEPPGFTKGIDWDWLEPTLEAGASRFPWFVDEGIDQAASWYGYYEVSPDHSPVLGRLAAEPSWVNACGFSGHGVQQAPAVGRLVTEEIVDGTASLVDIDAFRYERFAGAASASERHIV